MSKPSIQEALAALTLLHDTCRDMDAENLGARPTEDEYTEAMRQAADVIARARETPR